MTRPNVDKRVLWHGAFLGQTAFITVFGIGGLVDAVWGLARDLPWKGSAEKPSIKDLPSS